CSPRRRAPLARARWSRSRATSGAEHSGFPFDLPAPVEEGADLRRAPINANHGHPIVPVPEEHRAGSRLADWREGANVGIVETNWVIQTIQRPPRIRRVRHGRLRENPRE